MCCWRSGTQHISLWGAQDLSTTLRIRNRPSRETPISFETFEFDVIPGHEHESLHVRWVGREVIIPGDRIDTPSLPYALIKICLFGRGVLDWEDDRWEIEPGMVFWSTARQPNTLFGSKDGRMINLGMFLSGTEALEDIQQLLRAPVGAVRLKDPETVDVLFHEIAAEASHTSAHREVVCGLLARALLRRINAQAIFPEASNRLARQAFQRCREFIEQNFVQCTSLRDVAEACGVTIPYLCRLFDQFFHCSAYDYITRLKMNRAERLLLKSVTSIRNVAREVGYRDARLFARNFKAAYGRSPTEYRRLHAATSEEQ